MKGIIEIAKFSSRVRFQVPDIYRAMLELSDWKIETWGYNESDSLGIISYQPLTFTVTIEQKEE